MHKISLKQNALDHKVASLQSHGMNLGREGTCGSTALIKSMSQYFPIDGKEKKIETIEEKLNSDKKFFHCNVSILF